MIALAVFCCLDRPPPAVIGVASGNKIAAGELTRRRRIGAQSGYYLTRLLSTLCDQSSMACCSAALGCPLPLPIRVNATLMASEALAGSSCWMLTLPNFV